MYRPLKQLPEVSRVPKDILGLKGPVFGADMEWHVKTEVPTVLGVSDDTRAVSVPFHDGHQYFKQLLAKNPRAKVVGHNFLSSDLPVLAGMGTKIDPSRVEDTILRYWLNNMHLCKSVKKDDDEADRRGAGFMNLWAMLSQYTDFSNYKFCRESACEGACPKHDVFGYNGLDALGPVQALPGLLKQAQLLGVDKLYDMHAKLSLILYEMRTTGVLTDLTYTQKLRERFTASKNALYDKQTEEGRIPFNPDSPKQVAAYFAAHKIGLRNTKEETIKKLVEKLGLADVDDDKEIAALPKAERAILALRDWKALGDGADRWFKPRTWDEKKGEWDGYVDEDGVIHAHLGFFTSSARFQCTSPNLQNVPSRRRDPGTGEKMKSMIRRAIIAPEGYRLYKSDFSNAENRVFLHLAGYEIPKGVDLHDWVREIAAINEDSEFARALGGARDAAKSIQHAGNYLEGLVLLHPNELRESRIRSEIAAGARRVYPGWTFQGKVVSFTGANLAKRAFGDASWANRKRALDVAESYFGRFKQVREFQQAITKQAENESLIRPPNGYVCRSYGYQEERCKTACSIWGSQPISHYTKLAILNMWQIRERVYPILQVHDEIVMIAPVRFPEKYIAGLVRECMEVEVAEIPGLKVPIDVSAGAVPVPAKGITSNWGDT